VMKGPHRGRFHHVEASQVAAGRASIASSHALNGTVSSDRLIHARVGPDAVAD
jgi:hypothetical protein